MPFIKVWIHYVWATKYREPVLGEMVRPVLFRHIEENAKSKGIYLDRVNGYLDHIHCLVSLGSEQTVSKIAQLIKGESSFWLNNKSGMDLSRLAWQDDYFAVSVSEAALPAVRAYIDNQQEHHRKVLFAEEYNEFIERYGFYSFGNT